MNTPSMCLLASDENVESWSSQEETVDQNGTRVYQFAWSSNLVRPDGNRIEEKKHIHIEGGCPSLKQTGSLDNSRISGDESDGTEEATPPSRPVPVEGQTCPVLTPDSPGKASLSSGYNSASPTSESSDGTEEATPPSRPVPVEGQTCPVLTPDSPRKASLSSGYNSASPTSESSGVIFSPNTVPTGYLRFKMVGGDALYLNGCLLPGYTQSVLYPRLSNAAKKWADKLGKAVHRIVDSYGTALTEGSTQPLEDDVEFKVEFKE